MTFGRWRQRTVRSVAESLAGRRRLVAQPGGLTLGIALHLACVYTYGEVMSHKLQPRYDRHFVGIARRNVWS